VTYFTDSVYERMMMEKPRCRQEKQTPASKDKNKDDKSKHYRELIIIIKERNEKK